MKELIKDESALFVVSPFRSCKQTLSYIAGSFSEKEMQCVEDARIRNQNFGSWFLTERPEVAKRLEDESQKVGPFYYKYPQGESAADVYDRVCSVFETMNRKMAQPNPPQNVVIVTHNVVCQCFLLRFFHWEAASTFHNMKRFPGGAVTVLEKQPDGSYLLTTPLPFEGTPPRGVAEVMVSRSKSGGHS